MLPETCCLRDYSVNFYVTTTIRKANWLFTILHFIKGVLQAHTHLKLVLIYKVAIRDICAYFANEESEA